MRILLSIFFIVFFALLFQDAQCQNLIKINLRKQEVPVSEHYAYYIDSNNSQNLQTVLQKHFINASGKIPLYPVEINNVWIKFIVQNNTYDNNLYFDLRYTNLSTVELYQTLGKNNNIIGETGNSQAIACDSCIVPNFLFQLHQPAKTTQTYLLHIRSIHPIIVPAYICTIGDITRANSIQLVMVALFAGTLCAMLAYNLFLYFAVRDKSYLVYVIYTFTVLLAQLTASGYMHKYVWPKAPLLNLHSVVWTTNFSIITGIIFTINFLHVRANAQKTYWLFVFIISLAFADMLLSLFQYYNLSYKILNYNSIFTGITIFIASLRIAWRGYKPAYFYFIAWSCIVIALVLLALTNMGILPYNKITSNIVYIGSVLEATLLSIALADKINILRREKEISQAESLHISKENAQLIQQQNVVLEQKITERTQALEQTLSDLKDAQIQLIESEKMASLGQLTAGIAHEINNPINFVKSNVRPLQLDLHDLFELINRYQKLHNAPERTERPMLNAIKLFEDEIDPDFIKEEIQNLIGGIEEGAERTAEIVRSLRNFSRLDESEIKTANIHEGIDSTLLLIKNLIPPYISVVKDFKAEGDLECYPSKLNQVFMNILTNAIQAIKAKPRQEQESIVISTCDTGGYLEISIKDSGIGMTEEVKHKIFDPFFTTKEVGEGTGLGMSITFKIIEKHQGKISVISSPGNGSEIILSIPYQQSYISTTLITDDHK